LTPEFGQRIFRGRERRGRQAGAPTGRQRRREGLDMGEARTRATPTAAVLARPPGWFDVADVVGERPRPEIAAVGA
jgi:hypothetical protein